MTEQQSLNTLYKVEIFLLLLQSFIGTSVECSCINLDSIMQTLTPEEKIEISLRPFAI